MLPGIEPAPPAVEGQIPNPWSIRKVSLITIDIILDHLAEVVDIYFIYIFYYLYIFIFIYNKITVWHLAAFVGYCIPYYVANLLLENIT